MIVYHTSDVVVNVPDISHSRKFVDFGEGFYVTPLMEQAVQYGLRYKAMKRKAILNIYDFNFDKSRSSYKYFEFYDEEWLDYVFSCRKGFARKNYDVIEGGVANDRVFDTVDLYFSGLIAKEEALRRLMYVKPNWQICIASQKVLDECLTFKNSEDIP